MATPKGLPPPGRTRTVAQVERVALAVPKIAGLRREHPRLYARSFLRDEDRWQVSVYDGKDEIGQVLVDDASGRVLEAWTGVQVDWTMARGYPGAFGRRAAAPYTWLPLLALFLLPFARPPWRMLHLDLLVLCSLSVSFAFFSHAEVGASVPLAYPPLVYLLVRMLAIARRRARGDPVPSLRLRVGEDFLSIAIVFLIGFRLGMQISASNVIDVGYAGVIGADHIAHGAALWGHFPPDNPHGDTYGPVNYLAYVPFEAIWPWHGAWDDLPAAHAAASAFDLACAGGLWLLGRRLGGALVGLLLAYLWLACPFTLLAANSGTNDALVGALVLGALLLAAWPAARATLIGLAALTKFAPLVLAPLFTTNRRGAAALAATLVAGVAFVAILDGGLSGFYESAIHFQATRHSPFSLWGYYDLHWLGRVVEVAAAALAVAVAFVPRRRDVVVLAALAAAVLIALQLGVEHWFYLYLVWFVAPLLVALLSEVAPAAGRARSSPPGPAASSG